MFENFSVIASIPFGEGNLLTLEFVDDELFIARLDTDVDPQPVIVEVFEATPRGLSVALGRLKDLFLATSQ